MTAHPKPQVLTLLISCILSFLLLVTLSQADTLDDGLTARFNFEGNITDSSPNNLVGSVYGNLNYGQGVVGNYAAKFDGSTAITFPEYFYRTYSAGSLNLFIKPDPSMNYTSMVEHSYVNYGVNLYYNGIPNTIGPNSSYFPITPGQWTMLTCTWPANYGKIKIYENGVYVGETAPNIIANGYLGTWYHGQPYNSVIGNGVGPSSGFNNTSFKGMMDDMRFYNRALSDTEIKQLYTPLTRIANVNIPTPTATPPISALPQPSNLYVESVPFIKNNISSFSPNSQQYLNDNLNAFEKFLVKNTSGQEWCNFFKKAEETSKLVGDLFSLSAIGASTVDPVTGALNGLINMGIYSYKNLFYKSYNLANDYETRSVIDGIIFLSKNSTIPFNPVTALLSFNGIVYRDFLAGALHEAANDPPDPNFKEVFQSKLANTDPFNFLGISSELNKLMGLEFGSLYNAYYFLDGMTTSINRYSSALEAGDAISAGLQFEAFVKYLTLYDNAAIQAADYVKQLRQAMIDQGIADYSYSKQAILDLQIQLRLNGLPQELIDYYKSLGLMDSDIAALVQAMVDFVPPDSVSGSLYSNLSDSSNLLLSASSTPVPLPSTLMLLGSGLAGLTLIRRRFGIKR